MIYIFLSFSYAYQKPVIFVKATDNKVSVYIVCTKLPQTKKSSFLYRLNIGIISPWCVTFSGIGQYMFL